jgi:hypothetical protein
VLEHGFFKLGRQRLAVRVARGRPLPALQPPLAEGLGEQRSSIGRDGRLGACTGRPPANNNDTRVGVAAL